MTPVLLRSLKMLSLCFGLGVILSGCLGSGDEECSYKFESSYRITAHEIRTTCGVSPQITGIKLKRGTHQVVGRTGVQSTTEIYSLGCELRLRHDERSIFVEDGKESIDGVIEPLSGPNLLEGWATFERKNPDGSVKCTGEYYLVLTNVEHVSQKTEENREN